MAARMERPALALSALAAGFAGFGLFWGAFAATSADVVRAFGLGRGEFGLVLGCFPLAGVPMALVAGRLADRFGSHRLAAGGGLGFGLAAALLALSPTTWALPPAAMLVGACSSSFDVGLNTEVVSLEGRVGRRVLGRMHALFFAGSAGGGGLAAAMLAAGTSWRAVQLTAAGAVLTAVALLAAAGSPDPAPAGGPRERGPGPLAALRSRAVRRLAALVLVAFLLEGGTESWAGIYLRDDLGVAAAGGGLGVGLLFGCMSAGSATSDALDRHLGAVRILALGGAGSATGLWLASATGQPLVAAAGFGLTGLSIALVTPTAYSEAGRAVPHARGAAVASITLVGYVAFLVGPMAMGGLASLIGLRGAFALLGVTALAVLVGAARHEPAPAATTGPAGELRS